MISSYAEYIERFAKREGLAEKVAPGEHHFVAVYLLPKLYSINGTIPDYVNPDGTKRILGDIVYFKDGAHFLGIEVKVETIRLTANEFNNWILETDAEKHPNVFVGVGTKGLVLQSWRRFNKWGQINGDRINGDRPH